MYEFSLILFMLFLCSVTNYPQHTITWYCLKSPLSRQSATRFGRQKNGQLSKKGNMQQCQNYRTISLISHPSKVMLKTILNRLKPQAEKIIAEEQAGFTAGRSTTQQIFNLRILCEKYLQHPQDFYHIFIDFKKAFDRVWHAALWATMKKYNISTTLSKLSKTSITWPLVPSSSTAA